MQIAFALLNGKADGCSRGKKQGNEAKDSVVGRRAFAAANGKSCGVRAAGGHFGGRRECVAADDLRGGERVVQAERAASSSRVKIWLKSKPLIRFGMRKVLGQTINRSLVIFNDNQKSLNAKIENRLMR